MSAWKVGKKNEEENVIFRCAHMFTQFIDINDVQYAYIHIMYVYFNESTLMCIKFSSITYIFI